MAEIPFTVSARTARLIGRENVANAEGALIELVKNCYDADSKNSIILIDKKNDTLLLIDTGEGMNSQIISEQWMTIGTDDKLYNAVTASGRIKSGAKGIGRFALDRLGEKCTMLTFPKSDFNHGYVWNVDWNRFEQKDDEGRNVKINEVFANIDDIVDTGYFSELKKNIDNDKVIEILEEINTETKIDYGTALIIKGLRDNWSDNNISKVFQTLELLNPPEGLNKIKIWLLSTEEPKKYGLVENDEFQDYDYKLVATYKKNDTFKVDFDIHRNEFDFNLIPKELFNYSDMQEFPFDMETFKNEKFNLTRTFPELIKGLVENSLLLKNIGDFEFTFYFLKNTLSSKDREKFYQKEFLGNRGKWIEKFGGIKLYRDDFRIRPYGELNTQSYDWLLLGERYGQNPAAFSRKGSRVRPNQVAGVVKFSRLDNPYLEDKSNREGIQESDTFEFFKNLLKAIIKVLEDDRSTVGFNLDKLFSDLNQEEENIEETADIANEENDENESPEETKEKNKKLKRGVQARDKKLSEKENELATSRAMASAGIMIASFSHEFHGIKNNLTSRVFLFKKRLNDVVSEEDLQNSSQGIKLSNELDKLYRQDQKLKQWIDFAIGLTKRDRRKNKKINIVEYFSNFKQIWDVNLFTERNITFSYSFTESPESYTTNISELDLDTVFDNLITNSIEAFQRNGVNGERKIDVNLTIENNKDIRIKYSDSGPGIISSYSKINDIFKPFETSKVDDLGNPVGTGLGMWLVKSAVDSNKGKVLLSKPQSGFEIDFWFKKIK
ncbi:ATP-binding protein [Flavobacterium sharifuzzamanii]|uniref:ATP-binding protein n=1 Tax=Flavobacterium sharifuzzamanii TaxID=2211133 RepID=UPI000DAD00F6|nr:ATP-binding protein [Flavobacterium sharifuzzamanii]KAF2082009.1 sensor histidine kinase [Flavobacterium sharifuzzamanii]